MSQPKTKMLGLPRELRAPARPDAMDLDEASSEEEEQELDEDNYDDEDEQGSCALFSYKSSNLF
jgi:hypothetical protein